MDIKVIDVYAYLHYGTKSKFKGEFNHKNMPIGGLNLLHREVLNCTNSGYLVVLCFDSATDRRKYLPEYKSNREKYPSIDAQAEFAYEFYRSCGVVCEKHYGYEADDLIYTICEKYRDDYHIDEISIYTGDKDIAHNIISKEIIRNVSVDTSAISRATWSYAMTLNGVPTLYNTITFRKLLEGDKSDTIRSFSSDGQSGIEMYKEICSFIDHNFAMKLRDKEFVKNLDSRYSGKPSLFEFTEEESKYYQNRVEVFYPRFCNDMTDLKGDGVGVYKHQLLADYALVFKDKYLLGRLTHKAEINQDVYNLLNRYAEKYKNYEYHATNNVNVYEDTELEIKENNTFIRSV